MEQQQQAQQPAQDPLVDIELKPVDPRFQKQALVILTDLNNALTSFQGVLDAMRTQVAVVAKIVMGHVNEDGSISTHHEATDQTQPAQSNVVKEAAARAIEKVGDLKQAVEETIAAKFGDRYPLKPTEEVSAPPQPSVEQPTPHDPMLSPTNQPIPLAFSKYAVQVFSANSISGGRGFLNPKRYNESLFDGPGSINMNRLTWGSGYYAKGDEFMFTFYDLRVVYEGLSQKSLDECYPTVYFVIPTNPTNPQSPVSVRAADVTDGSVIRWVLQKTLEAAKEGLFDDK